MPTLLDGTRDREARGEAMGRTREMLDSVLWLLGRQGLLVAQKRNQFLQVKSVSELEVNLPRLAVVSSAKRRAVIEQKSTVHEVQRRHRKGQVG